MTKTFKAPFIQAQNTNAVVLDTAGTNNTDTPTNTELLFTAGADDSLVASISAMPRATVTATALSLFRSSDAGTTKRIVGSVLMEAHTVAATTAIPVTVFLHLDGTPITRDNPMEMQAGDTLYVNAGVSLAGGIVVNCTGGDY